MARCNALKPQVGVRRPDHEPIAARVDSLKIATLLRGGNLPHGCVYPPELRARRDLLRRRQHLVRQGGSFLAHIQNTHHQYNLPEPSARIAYKANRAGVPEVFDDPDARKSIEVDFMLVEQYDTIIRDIENHLERQVKKHDPQAYYRLRTTPGIGKIPALTILYEIHDIGRFPRVQDFPRPRTKPDQEACERSGDLCHEHAMASWSMSGICSA